jgi:hypothetical protein
VFKSGRGLLRSPPVAIAGNLSAPIFLSKRKTAVISDDVRNYPLPTAFNDRYLFNEHVRSFPNMPIGNFINYHTGALSSMAFNSMLLIYSGLQ